MTRKVNISHTKLFKQVRKVLGSSEALKQLNIAYKSYNKVGADMEFGWEGELAYAFAWCCTEQGWCYWGAVDDKLAILWRSTYES